MAKLILVDNFNREHIADMLVEDNLDEKEANLLRDVARKSREVSTYSCMPIMKIKPLNECSYFELLSVGIKTNDDIIQD